MEIEINLIKLLREEIRNIPKPYNDPSISLTVYRTLTGRTKHFVNIMMFGHAIPRKGFKVIDANLRDDYLDRNSEPSELKIFVEEETKGMDQNVRSQDVKFLLEPHLMKTLVNIFSSKYEPKFQETTLETEFSFEKIMEESLGKWRRIHQSIVKPSSQSPQTIQKTLEKGGLINRRGDDWEITSDGFQFVLNSTRYQINAFIYYYAKYLIKDKQRSTLTVFSTLCALNLCLSELKDKSDMTNTRTYYAYKIKEDADDVREQREIINDLVIFGLVYKQDSKSDVFMITPLFSNFLFEKTHTFNTESNLNLIVETNFKIYAYTNSQLHIDLLTNFARINYRLPNLTVATLTQKSVKTAFRKKIKREQVVNFLNKNIHIEQKKLAEKEAQADKEAKTHIADSGNVPIRENDILEKIKKDGMYSSDSNNLIPENVDQQLRMWENEKDEDFDENDDSDREY